MKELLTKVKEYIPITVAREDFFGLCGVIYDLELERIIDRGERLLLHEYITQKGLEKGFNVDPDTFWLGPMKESKSRIEFLNELIEEICPQ